MPKVSVIVPAFNGSKYIEKLLNSLSNQDYSETDYEVIIIDNNSTDGTQALISKYPVTLLEERDRQSSYAARNKGLEHARGEIIAFTDADCIPAENWISAGVEALRQSSADLIGGRIDFIFSENPSTSELFDSIFFLNTETAVKEGKAQTANIFVTRKVIETIGPFSQVVSGGDTEWTMRAVRNGFKLLYRPEVIVRHPTRKFKHLMSKSFRVGTGGPSARLAAGFTFVNELMYHTFYLLPFKYRLKRFAEKIDRQEKVIYQKRKYKLIMLYVLVKFLLRTGAFCGMMGICVKKMKCILLPIEFSRFMRGK